MLQLPYWYLSHVKEQLKAFLEKVKGDTSLQEKLKVAADDLTKAQYQLSGQELEGVAG